MSDSHIPPCKNPNHPKGVDRKKSMIVLEENADRVCFACVACKDIEKILSVQVVTLPRGWAAAKFKNDITGVTRAKEVVKGARGRIRYFNA
jgi:hypothetical protein